MALGILLSHRASLHLAVTKKAVSGGEKLLTYLNSALKALLGFDIFPLVPKKCEILLPSEIFKNTHFFSHFTWLS